MAAAMAPLSIADASREKNFVQVPKNEVARLITSNMGSCLID
jgi:hypothetical protein